MSKKKEHPIVATAKEVDQACHVLKLKTTNNCAKRKALEHAEEEMLKADKELDAAALEVQRTKKIASEVLRKA